MTVTRSLPRLVCLALFTLATACVGVEDDGTDLALGAGYGAPSGSHVQLNIIGVPKGKSANLSGGDGRRIFMPLEGMARINLSPGDLAVLDANGTDGVAAFQLPNPDPDGDGVTSYWVFARALGTPGGQATITTCAADPTTGETVCSTDALLLLRTKGKQTFSDVSRQLLFVTVDLDGDGVEETIPLFDESLEGFFWDFDNQGLKLAQLRSYDGA
jgi:hypothetical protein